MTGYRASQTSQPRIEISSSSPHVWSSSLSGLPTGLDFNLSASFVLIVNHYLLILSRGDLFHSAMESKDLATLWVSEL